MSYDHKITDLKFHLKGLVNKDICSKLINFYEQNKYMAFPESSDKFNGDLKTKVEKDNCNFLNVSLLRGRPEFVEPYTIILKYLRIVLTQYEIYMRQSLCPVFVNSFYTKTDNIRIIKYDTGQCIKDHSDVDPQTRGSLTINLNDNYEGGEFRFFGGLEKVNLSEGEAMLFPAEPVWIHGTEPVTKGARYAINCFLKQ